MYLMEDKKKAKMEEKAAKKRAKMQAKIDKVASKVTLFRQTLTKYQQAFEADGDIDSKEQKKLAKIQKKIDKVEEKIKVWCKRAGLKAFMEDAQQCFNFYFEDKIMVGGECETTRKVWAVKRGCDTPQEIHCIRAYSRSGKLIGNKVYKSKEELNKSGIKSIYTVDQFIDVDFFTIGKKTNKKLEYPIDLCEELKKEEVEDIPTINPIDINTTESNCGDIQIDKNLIPNLLGSGAFDDKIVDRLEYIDVDMALEYPSDDKENYDNRATKLEKILKQELNGVEVTTNDGRKLKLADLIRINKKEIKPSNKVKQPKYDVQLTPVYE